MSNSLKNEVTKLLNTYYNKGDISQNIITISKLLNYDSNIVPIVDENGTSVNDLPNNSGTNNNNGNNNNGGNNNDNINVVDPDNPTVYVDNNGVQIYNNWTDGNIATVRTWKLNLFKSVFIYSYVLEKYKKILNSTLTIAMILGYVNSIVNGVSTALLAIGKNYVWVTFGLSIATLTISTIITILNSLLQIRGWSGIVSEYSVFVDKINSFYSLISNLLILPNKIKTDAITFIKDQNKTYLDIMMKSPSLQPSDYTKANNKFVQYIKNESVNYTVEQKYGQNDNVIDIV